MNSKSVINNKVSLSYLFREFANRATNKAGEEVMGFVFSFLTGGISDVTEMFKTIRIK